MKKYIPNIITLLNLFSGCLALSFVFEGRYGMAVLFVLFAAVLDLLDGMLARALNAYSDIGKELDSLADVLSFGIVPAFMAYFLMIERGDFWGAYASFLIALGAAYRLAKFNVSTEQSTSFLGMPTPANALFWTSLYYFSYSQSEFLHPLYVLFFVCLFTLLMVSNFKMFSFKFSSWTWNNNRIIYLYIITTIISFILFNARGLSLMILLYPLFSWIHFKTK